MHRRGKGDIWQGLFEFPMIEDTSLLEPDALLQTGVWQSYILIHHPVLYSEYHDFIHQLTHQQLHSRFFKVQLKMIVNNKVRPDWVWVSEENLHTFPISRLTGKFLNILFKK